MRFTSICIILLLISACTSKQVQDIPSEPVHASSPIKSAAQTCSPAMMSSIRIAEETAGYDIDIEYPVLCSPEATQAIRDHVTRSLSDFKMEFPEHDLSDYPHKHQMITEYAIWLAGHGRLASVKLQEMVYTGGAHPNNWPVTWVFDLTDGHMLTLSDIFVDRQDALIKIAEMVRDMLGKTLGDMHVESMLQDGSTPTTTNYADFILNDEGVAFFFAPYQVAPYASGQQVVTIPYERLDKHLTPEIKTILH
jgi:hypothetical protein